MTATITSQTLRTRLSYDGLSGHFFWLVSPVGWIKVGDRAGAVKGNGYRYVTIAGRGYLEHRLAWFYEKGFWPARIDHKDGNQLNNVFANLREATQSQNMANAKIRRDNVSGVKGVSWDRGRKKWTARVVVDGRCVFRKRFENKAKAAEECAAAAVYFYGRFARP